MLLASRYETTTLSLACLRYRITRLPLHIGDTIFLELDCGQVTLVKEWQLNSSQKKCSTALKRPKRKNCQKQLQRKLKGINDL